MVLLEERNDSVEADSDVFVRNDLDDPTILLRTSSGRRRTDDRRVALCRLLGSGGFGIVYLGERRGEAVWSPSPE